jgi:phosphatidylglycerol lysyltransferase
MRFTTGKVLPHRAEEGTSSSQAFSNGGKGVFGRIAGPAFAVAACAAVLILVYILSRGIDYHAMVAAMRRTPRDLLAASVLLTALSYLALVARDQMALNHSGVSLPSSALMLASFCATALGNALGFGALTEHTVRERVYNAVGVRPEQAARATRLVSIAFAAGLAALAAGGLILSGSSLSQVLRIPVWATHAAGIVVLIAIGASLALNAGRRLPAMTDSDPVTLPSAGNAAAQMLMAAADLMAAALALWVLLPAGTIDFPDYAVIFSAAIALGALSRIPGGLGVFEAVVFFSLHKLAPPAQVAAALLIFRGVYFLMPLVIAAAALAGLELRRPSAGPLTRAGGRVLLGAGLLAPVFLSVATFAVGVMLIVSGATPAVDWRLAALQGFLPLWAVEISHLLATLAGVFLLFVARGLYHRLDGAWWLALIVSLINVAFALAKGLAFGETAALLFLVFLLLATRRQFTRPAAFLRQPFTIGWFTAIAIVIAAATGILLFAFRDVAYRHEIWWQFEFDAQASRALRAMLAASIFASAISLWQFLRAAPGKVEPPSPFDLSRAAAIIRRQERSAPMLALMGDKSLLFSASGNSFLMYARSGRSWVALFDPVGPDDEWPELVWRFVELADAHGGRAAFYQIRPEGLALYLDAGLRIVKVGEEAFIPLQQFGLEGPQRYGLRQALKRAEREGMTFEVFSPHQLEDQQEALKGVSQAWLTSHKASERRFSVAAFEPEFVAAQSAVIARQKGKPVGFVTFMTTSHRSEATVGLMRQVPDASPYTMEFLLTRLALELKARGFERFSLGMAPLAGIARSPLSSGWHRLAGMLWEHGRAIYNFQGLRAFKNKFRPAWEPRYLAVSGAVGPFIGMADVVALVSGHSR